MKTPNETEIYEIWGTRKEQISDNICIQYVWGTRPRWETHIIVDEKTTADELRQNWAKIDAAKSQNVQYQGSDPLIEVNAIQQFIHKQKKEKNKSYGMIAKDLNFDSLLCLLWSRRDKLRKDEVDFGKEYFESLFRILRPRDNQFFELYSDGKERIMKGEIPWGLRDGPFSNENVRYSINHFEKLCKQKEINVNPNEDWKKIDKIRDFFVYKGTVHQLSDLLEKQRPKDYSIYKERLKERIMETIISMEIPGLIST
jgi:hypothetical protein